MPVVALPLPVIPLPPGVLLVAPPPVGAADPLPEPEPIPDGVVEVAPVPVVPVPVVPVPLLGSQPTFATSNPVAIASNRRTFIELPQLKTFLCSSECICTRIL